MEDTLRGATRAVNMENVGELVSELLELVRVLRPIADRVLAADHIFAPPERKTRSQREENEARAIVLVATLPHPTIGGIAKELNVPKTTLRSWPHFREAFRRRVGSVRAPRRGVVDRDGDVDGLD